MRKKKTRANLIKGTKLLMNHVSTTTCVKHAHQYCKYVFACRSPTSFDMKNEVKLLLAGREIASDSISAHFDIGLVIIITITQKWHFIEDLVSLHQLIGHVKECELILMCQFFIRQH